jgi:hypothetical protein
MAVANELRTVADQRRQDRLRRCLRRAERTASFALVVIPLIVTLAGHVVVLLAA